MRQYQSNYQWSAKAQTHAYSKVQTQILFLHYQQTGNKGSFPLSPYVNHWTSAIKLLRGNARLGLEHTLGRGLLCQIPVPISLSSFLLPDFIPIEYFHPSCFLSSLQKAFLLYIARKLINNCCQLSCPLPQWQTRSGNSNCCTKVMICCGLYTGLGVQTLQSTH